MSLHDPIKSLQDKIDANENHILQTEIDENNTKRNTQRTRKNLLCMAHYYHLLQNLGEQKSDSYKVELYCGIVRLKIQKARKYDGIEKEVAELNLIDEHTRAWNLAEYYYEKASKILCQMIITLMDYILQEKVGFSILYKGKDKSSYFNLLDEITALNESYRVCGCFLSVYDFCTEKIADFTGIEEYRELIKEHERIVKNGLPQRVTETMEKLQDVAGKEKAEYFTDLFKAYTPRPPYIDEMLEIQYENAISEFGSEVKAMTCFSSLVIKTDEYYEGWMKE
jgi:hypothetical protein